MPHAAMNKITNTKRITMDKSNMVEVLLVEDNDDDAFLAIRGLKEHNFGNKILRLHDGEEAQEYLLGIGEYEGRNTKDVPRVILLDINMPKVSGLELLKIIRENEDTRKIPVVLLTSSKEERDLAEAYEYGVNSYIVKPVDFMQFSAAMKHIGYYWVVLNELQ